MIFGATTLASRGAELLDRERPDWFRLINMDDFDMRGYTRCVLGQVFGGYLDGVIALGMDPLSATPEEHGFIVCQTASVFGYMTAFTVVERYEQLQSAWITEILRRRNST